MCVPTPEHPCTCPSALPEQQLPRVWLQDDLLYVECQTRSSQCLAHERVILVLRASIACSFVGPDLDCLESAFCMQDHQLQILIPPQCPRLRRGKAAHTADAGRRPQPAYHHRPNLQGPLV